MGTVSAVLVLVSVVAAGVQGCSQGFEEVGGQCYSFRSDVTMTWSQAKDLCAELGASTFLASITNADTFRAVYEYIMTYGLSGSFWLGGNDAEYEGDWHWLDGSRVTKGTPFWAIHNGILGWVQEPDGGSDENCLALDTERKYYFNDLSCDQGAHPLCQEA